MADSNDHTVGVRKTRLGTILRRKQRWKGRSIDTKYRLRPINCLEGKAHWQTATFAQLEPAKHVWEQYCRESNNGRDVPSKESIDFGQSTAPHGKHTGRQQRLHAWSLENTLGNNIAQKAHWQTATTARLECRKHVWEQYCTESNNGKDVPARGRIDFGQSTSPHGT